MSARRLRRAGDCVVAVGADSVMPLRGEILRPGQPLQAAHFAGDDAEDSLHAAYVCAGRTIGVASVMREPFPLQSRESDWRVRGMATMPAERGRGIGSALLERCEAHARAQGGHRLWCNARAPARAFYERAGMTVEGDPFELPEIGLHYLMYKEL